jgi:hypothetical protein
VDIDPIDVHAWRHDLTNRPICKPHDSRNDRAFVLFENSRRLSFGNDQLQLFGGDDILGFPV